MDLFVFFDLTYFRELGQKYKNILFVFGSNKNFKICIRDLLTFAFYLHFPDESRITWLTDENTKIAIF